MARSSDGHRPRRWRARCTAGRAARPARASRRAACSKRRRLTVPVVSTTASGSMVVTRPIGTKMRRRAWISTASPSTRGASRPMRSATTTSRTRPTWSPLRVEDGQAGDPRDEDAGARAHRSSLRGRLPRSVLPTTGAPRDRPRPLPPRRQGRRRHRRLLRAGRRLRAGLRRGRRRRRARRAPRRPAARDRQARRGRGPPLRLPADRRDRPRAVHRPGAEGGRRVRPGRRAGQQRGPRLGEAGQPRDAGGVPARPRREPQRRLLVRAGVRPGGQGRRLDHQHLQRPRHAPGRAAAGGVRRVQGRADRPDPRPRRAVDRPQGHPRQRHRAGLLPDRDDRRDGRLRGRDASR